MCTPKVPGTVPVTNVQVPGTGTVLIPWYFSTRWEPVSQVCDRPLLTARLFLSSGTAMAFTGRDTGTLPVLLLSTADYDVIIRKSPDSPIFSYWSNRKKGFRFALQKHRA
jgi:hypothetical protein